MIFETKLVDSIYVKKTGDVVMVITDHVPWDETELKNDYDLDELGHIYLLQEKINYYLGILESGELWTKFPQFAGRQIDIEVVGKYKLSKRAEEFYDKFRAAIEGFGFKLLFRWSL